MNKSDAIIDLDVIFSTNDKNKLPVPTVERAFLNLAALAAAKRTPALTQR